MIPAVIERGAGIDVGKDFLAVCIMIGPPDEEPRVEQRTYGTMNADLIRLREWLLGEGCTHVAMESTGSYWKPVFNVLEEQLAVFLANPEDVKGRKGHKTDHKDSWWLAHLLRHAMIRPSFIPPRAIRELRDLTRRRKQLLHDATSERNRIQKVLEDANVKLGSVLADLFGASGQLMLEALLDGKASPEEMAQFARGRAKQKIPQLVTALEGHRMSDHPSCAYSLQLRPPDFSGGANPAYRCCGCPKDLFVRLSTAFRTIADNSWHQEDSAASILAETGVDMSVFPSAGHLSSWVGWTMSRQPTKRGKESRRPNYSRKPLVERNVDSVCLGRGLKEWLLHQGEVLAACSTRQKASLGCNCP
jgi:transposase